MGGSIGGGGGESHAHSSSVGGYLSPGDKKLKQALRGMFESRLGGMGVQGLAYPAYDKSIVLPYSAAQNAGLLSLQNAANPIDTAGIGTAARGALANQFSTLLAPELRSEVGALGGGRYST